MTHSFPSLTIVAAGWLACWAAAPRESAAQSPAQLAATAAATGGERGQGGEASEGQRIIELAAQKLAAENSLECRVRQRIDAFGQQLVGAGTYLQFGVGEERRLRLELKLQVGNQVSSIQQICDSRRLWLRRDFPDGQTLMRIDLRRAREAVAAAYATGAADGSVHETAGMTTGFAWLEGGGLPNLLGSLADNFQFTLAPENASKENYAIVGVWKPERLQLVARPDKLDKKRNKSKALPAQAPARVVVTLARDEQFPLFPYRIEYFGQLAEGAEQGRAGEERLLSRLEFYDIRRLPHVDPRQFEYLPGEQEVIDGTDAYVARWFPQDLDTKAP